MRPFLRQVAEHYFAAHDIESQCFIFPNRRSLAFFRKYLAEAVADPGLNAGAYGHGGRVRPVIMPLMYTVNDFFYRVYGAGATDRVLLLLELYECYRELNPKAESLDEFIFWGDVLLGDFNDTDKYLADPRGLFTNVADFKELQDSYSYLTPGQEAAIKTFIGHFREGGKLKVRIGGNAPDVKERFLMIWDLLYPLYTGFNKRLESKGMSYEGMVYRSIADRLDKESAADVFGEAFPSCDKFIFVGLNALNACEKKAMRKMRDAGISEFCWDYVSPMIKDARNKSSFFMDQNMSDFKPSWEIDPEGIPEPEINVVSVPSSVGQAKQIPGIIAGIAKERGGDMAGAVRLSSDVSGCAIVLPDETLLAPLLNSIPEEITEINVTMGYPMTGSAFYAFMSEVAALQLHLRKRGDEWLFYHKHVRNLFSGSIFRKVTDEAGTEVVERIKSEARYYVPAGDFKGAPIMELIFRPVITGAKADDKEQIKGLEAYLKEIVEAVAPALGNDPDMAPEMEFARKYLGCLNSLSAAELPVQPQTYIRILDRLLSGISVPYEGEPLKGLQIMGPLETRALDFRNLVILSCNEGIFPRRSVSSSFIPPELRRGFSLPTYEYQDAVWAYYFYRMIQRASKVWLIYDSRTEKMKSGEESRYIKQLRYHFNVPMKRFVAKAEIASGTSENEIRKPADIDRILRGINFSATSLQNYLACPAKFYYSSIEKLKPEAEVAEALDAGMIGKVFHSAMQALYLGEKAMEPSFFMDSHSVGEAVGSGNLVPLKEVSLKYIETWLGRGKDIKARIRTLVETELRTNEVSGRNLVIEDVIFQYVRKALQRDAELLRSAKKEAFRVLGLELPKEWKFKGYNFFGYIDRVDSFEDGKVRIVDYKTGRVEKADTEMNDAIAEETVEKLFGKDNAKRPKIALQMFLYDMYMAGDPLVAGKNVENVIYSVSKLFTDGVLSSEKNDKFCHLAEERLAGLIDEIADASIPFNRTEDRETCAYCDFKTICGR